MFRPYYTKIRLKSKALARKLKKPTRVLDIEQFYSRHWQGPLPNANFVFARTNSRFFFDPKALGQYQKALRSEFPKSCSQIIRRADKAVAHIFDMLGSGERSLGDKIDWHKDFKSGKRWEPKPFYNIRIVDFTDNSDVKVPWELSRLQFLPDLGRAYWLTGNLNYGNEFREILKNWDEANPVDIGVNWTCSMEVAIRAINIIWGLHYFAQDIDEDFLRRVIRLLYYHGLHIEKNLEYVASGANSNHLISDFLGLLYLGILFPEFDRAKKWKRVATEGLEREIRNQVFSDGPDYECSTSYHRLVLEMFLSAFILGRVNAISFSDVYKDRLRKMIDFSLAMTPTSGHVPLMGDNDDGFVVKLSTDDPTDHRELIDLGLVVFGERVPYTIPMTEERLWYLGLDSLIIFSSHKNASSQQFKKGGYAIIKNDDFQLVFNCAGIPEKSIGGHKHNDLLSFTLEIEGKPYLIDPGTFCYSADFKMRNLSRSTAFHNTVTIDGREQNRFFEKRLFYMSHDAKPHISLWANTGDCVVVSASHTGYARLNDAIIHKRTIWVSLEAYSIMIQDDFAGKENDNHTFDLSYMTPSRDVSRTDLNSAAVGDQKYKHLIINVSEACLKDGKIKAIEYFPRYGAKEPATLITYTYLSRLPFQIITKIARGSKHLPINDQFQVTQWDLKKRFETAGLAI
jgi:hypothetical protein